MFERLSDSAKAALELIVIRGSAFQSEFAPSTRELNGTPFLNPEDTSAEYSLKPIYAKIAPRLLKEWRRSKGT